MFSSQCHSPLQFIYKRRTKMEEALDFFRIHDLVDQFSGVCNYLQDERLNLALTALQIMDKYQALHPKASELTNFLADTNSPEFAKFSPKWISEVLAQVSVPEYLLEGGILKSPGKEKVLEEFVTFYRQKFIEGDFKSIAQYVARVKSMLSFLGSEAAANHGENRFLEFTFYQVASIVYGLVWGLYCLSLKYSGPEGGAFPKLASLEKKSAQYSGKIEFKLSKLNPEERGAVDGEKRELDFHSLTLWLVLMTAFKRSEFLAFVAGFDGLLPKIHTLSYLGLQSDALAMYALASLACKPFKELSFKQNEPLVELYAELTGVEGQLYRSMIFMSNARFSDAKSLLSGELQARISVALGTKLPKSREPFWRDFTEILDLKVFLLIMSVTRCIPRAKLVLKLGYTDLTPAKYAQVSNRLIVLLSVLQLGRINITYDEQSDLFVREELDDKTREEQLAHELEQMAHTARAESAAQLLRGMLIEKYL